MQDFAAVAERRLREQGHRLTRPRRMVIAVLDSADKALSPYALQAALAESSPKPDVVTIYRVLELLEELHLVHRVHSANGYVACTRLAGSGCHHPIICTKCGRIGEFTGDGLQDLTDRLAATGWDVTGHVLEFQGLCPACRESVA